MNVLIINGSARKKGFCNHIANYLKNALEEFTNPERNVTVNYFNIPDSNVCFCKGCVSCCASENKYCFIDDDIQKAYVLMEKADSIVYISPIYESFISGVLKNFFDRTNHYTSFFKLAGKPLNLILSGVQPLDGKTKEFSNSHVVKNINDYFNNYSIITHTYYNYLGFFHHFNHHTEENEGDEVQFHSEIDRMAKEIISQKLDYNLIEQAKKPYSV